MASFPHVALIVETAKQYDRGLLRGVGRYIRGHGPWSVYIEERGPTDGVPAWLKRWRGDGIISRSRDAAMVEALIATGAPVVELRREVVAPDLPAVHCDDDAIARLAARHFQERGFRHLAYCGRPGARWSDLRRDAFRRRLEELGLSCQVYEPPRRAGAPSWEREQADVSRWLASLPQPVGVLACNDIRGLQVLDACRRIDLAVPERVAVLGVDDDVALCELADPPLSSVDQDLDRIGYEAAALLDRLMAGGPREAPILVEPLGVVPRLSTDVVAIDDPVVAEALRLLRLHACDGHGLDFVFERVGLSRRALERRFKERLGRTLLEEAHDVQLDRLRQLLAETDLKLDVVARKAGFHYIGYMCSFFKKRTGVTPGDYRRSRAGRPRAATDNPSHNGRGIG
ncbi:XylR family transcriptional regulator [Paludisphaera rhizosphaerae]|uniref:XylR family transcriptional regulator n=1 Tax=Paludisphaera rhizosphaerae TaxID=2711216 RepID=UPI0013EA117E|nr:DNA-binding transcriptional regulator [Paludisphaera rhizosphaerae]